MTKYEIIYYTDLNTEVENSEQSNQESSTLHNPFPANIGISGHSYRGAEKTVDGVVVDSLTPIGLNLVKDITIIEDSTNRLQNARQYQRLNPNKKILHEKRVEITELAYKKLSDNAALLEPYLTTSKDHPKAVPHELVGGEFNTISHNCNHWMNSEHRLADLEGTFTYYYSTQEFADTPGIIHTGVGLFRDKKQFVPGDKERTVVTDLSMEDFAAEQNLPLSRIKKKKLVKLPEPDGLMLQPKEKNAYVIAPNPKLVASAASEDEQINENFAQLAVTEDKGLDLEKKWKKYDEEDEEELYLKELDWGNDWLEESRLELDNERESKVKSIIEAALQAFKEKFESMRNKFKAKYFNDLMKSMLEASASAESGKAEDESEEQSIHQKNKQEIEALRAQLQSSYESDKSAIGERIKGEVNAFFQQKKAEFAIICAAAEAKGGFADAGPLNAEITAFKNKKDAEAQAENKAVYEKVQSQLKSFIAAKEAEAEKQCNEIKSSREQKLKTAESKIHEIEDNAKDKEKAQLAECDRKIRDIQEDTGLIERLKEVIGNSGDAEALINKELNVFLQGAASDFGVDAEIL